MKRLIVDALDVRYGQHILFKSASLEVEAGTMIGLLGPNGSGKTTFFDVICGLKKLNGGEVQHSFSKLLYLSQIIATPPVFRMFDVFNMMMLFCSDTRVTQRHALEKIEKWSPGIAERYCEIWKKKSSLCSYGEKRWFFTLSLLSVNADLVILDEPTAGLTRNFGTTFGGVWRARRQRVWRYSCRRITLTRSSLTAMTFTCYANNALIGFPMPRAF